MESAAHHDDAASAASAASPGAGLRVLTVTNLFPSPDAPAYGSFIASQVDSLRAAGVVTDVDFIDGRRSRWAYLSAAPRLRRRVLSGAYDLVHAHYSYSGVYPLIFHRLPLVVSFLGDDVIVGHERLGGLKRRVRDYVARRADAIIVKSREMKDVLERSGRGPGRKSGPPILVVPNGVDLERFAPRDRRACRATLGYDPARRYVLFPYDPERAPKGFALACAAMEIVARRYPAATIRVVTGEPPESMPLHYNASDLLLFTSAYEGSPNTIKEALACDLPIVAVPSGDVEERLARARGCHIVARSPEEIANAILAVLADPDPRSCGRAAVAELDIHATALRIVAVYKSLIA
jgi:glycosyltransferase involved in cell wall biosynthesis